MAEELARPEVPQGGGGPPLRVGVQPCVRARGETNTTEGISGSGHVPTLPVLRCLRLLNSFSGRKC